MTDEECQKAMEEGTWLAITDKSPPAVVKIDYRVGSWGDDIWQATTGTYDTWYTLAEALRPATAQELLVEDP